ncbi:MAG: ABC transporter ATP-binding protein [Firmicutes bacterium]|nr:ABC transporter ATP-binding protein [Bacillota bacterium]
MSIITADNLHKEFALKLKEPGLRGSIRALLRPRYRTVKAVRGVSFAVEEGESLAFIGPNGAGKSTTIKMLTGILHPSGGDARIMELVPWRQRRQLAMHIGTVFGQKSQLWFHLPPQDSFDLLARIYEVPYREYRSRLAKLVEIFELQELLKSPVRKLSLGQRMRCEIAACLLHNPRILFLDEPTIGLDVMARNKIRQLIARLNSLEGITVFLTSHDAGDIEKICKRVMVINFGEIILDTSVAELKRHYLKTKVISARLGQPIEEFQMPGVRFLKHREHGVKIQVDTALTPVEAVISRLMARASLPDINIADPPLEEIIQSIYQKPAQEVADHDQGS